MRLSMLSPRVGTKGAKEGKFEDKSVVYSPPHPGNTSC